MSQLSRTGVLLEEDLLKKFDRLITKRGYENRSEAIRDLIREALLCEVVDANKPVFGTLTLVYDHHVPESISEAYGKSARSGNDGIGIYPCTSGSSLLPGSHHHEGAQQGYSGFGRPHSRRGFQGLSAQVQTVLE